MKKGRKGKSIFPKETAERSYPRFPPSSLRQAVDKSESDNELNHSENSLNELTYTSPPTHIQEHARLLLAGQQNSFIKPTLQPGLTRHYVTDIRP